MIYCPHSADFGNSQEIVLLRMAHGWEGYGIYWAIIEKMCLTPECCLSTNYSLLAYDLRVDRVVLESVINDFGLFVVEPTCFYTQSIREHLLIKNDKSEKARRAAKLRWDRERSDCKKRKRVYSGFTPPSLKEVEVYCAKRNNGIDATLFLSFYEAKGWMIGRNKMKCWQAAIRTWEKNEKKTVYDGEPKVSATRLHPALQ